MDVAELEGEADAGDGTRPVVDVGVAAWHTTLLKARDVLGCDFFDWLSAVDEGDDGVRLVAHLWSIREKAGVIVRTLLPADAPVADTVVDVYPGAEWHERETHEMFGVDFTGHPHLEPLLLPPEFEGHPLRKDFILASRVAKPWPGAKEPGEGHGAPGARKRQPMRPPGVPEPGTWGPAEPATEAGEAVAERPARPVRRTPPTRSAPADPAEAGATAAAPERPVRRTPPDRAARPARSAPGDVASPVEPSAGAGDAPAASERPERPAPAEAASPTDPSEPPTGPARPAKVGETPERPALADSAASVGPSAPPAGAGDAPAASERPERPAPVEAASPADPSEPHTGPARPAKVGETPDPVAKPAPPTPASPESGPPAEPPAPPPAADSPQEGQ